MCKKSNPLTKGANPMDLDITKWVWSVISLPMIWLYARINSIDKKVTSAQLISAEKQYTKAEVIDLIDRSVHPVHTELKNISNDISRIFDLIEKIR